MGCAAARTLRGGANGTLPASRRRREIGTPIGAIAAIEPDSAVLTLTNDEPARSGRLVAGWRSDTGAPDDGGLECCCRLRRQVMAHEAATTAFEGRDHRVDVLGTCEQEHRR